MDKLRFEINSPCDFDSIFYGLADKYKGKTLSVFSIGTKLLPYISDHCAIYKYNINDIKNGRSLEHDLMRIKSSLPIIFIIPYSEYKLIKSKLSIGNHQWKLFLVNNKPVNINNASTIVNTSEESAIYFDYSLVDIIDKNKYPILTDYKHYDLVVPYAKELDKLDYQLKDANDSEKISELSEKINECRVKIKDSLYV